MRENVRSLTKVMEMHASGACGPEFDSRNPLGIRRAERPSSPCLLLPLPLALL